MSGKPFPSFIGKLLKCLSCQNAFRPFREDNILSTDTGYKNDCAFLRTFSYSEDWREPQLWSVQVWLCWWFQTQLFPSSKSEPQKQRKIIEWTIHLEARKSAFLTFQKAQKKIDFFSDYAFVCNANENRFFEMGSKNFVIWSSGPSGKVQSVSGTIQNQLIWFRNVCCKTYSSRFTCLYILPVLLCNWFSFYVRAILILRQTWTICLFKSS